MRPSAIFLSAYSTITIEPSTNKPTDTNRPNITIIFIYPPERARSVIAIKKDVGIDIPTIKADLIPNEAITKSMTLMMAFEMALDKESSISLM